jgi:thiosulfate/3-mercaptopyruvate sulfurtransferase
MKVIYALWLGTLLMMAFHSAAADEPPNQIIKGYARPELLVEPDWVEQHRADRNVRIVDIREEKAYSESHIPGAVRVEERPLRNPEERLTYLPRPEVFEGMARKAGIDNKSHVIIYDDQGGKMAARLWYVLHAFGHKRISLINGGWQKWTAEKRPVSAEVPKVMQTDFRVKEIPDMTCPLPEFLARKPNVVVLDVRSPDEYTGKTLSPGAKKEGRIPGAVNVEWKENVSGPNLEFKPADELRKMYAEKGITPDKEIVVHCGGGGRAAQSLFTLKLLGYPKVKVYYGSFADYSALPDVPIDK